MQCSDLWLNGVHIGSRRGGYLPLSVDVTDLLKPHNEILVRVDNQDNPLIPPGKPQAEMDFMYGSGLYRNARLTLTAPLCITDPLLENLQASGGVYVTYPEVSKSKAVVGVRIHIRNHLPRPVKFELSNEVLDANGVVVAHSVRACVLASAEAQQFGQEMGVRGPHLWSPDSPYLYTLVTKVVSAGRVVDEVRTQVGVRKVEVSREKGFMLNGEPIRLSGTNRHQDYPWVGPALSDGANARDALLIRRAGHNIVRLSHYPQSPEFLDACDRYGLMTIPCIPGWQFYNKDPRFVNRVRQDIRELIRRDRNHPSAVFWEPSLNETYPPVEVANDWAKTAKSESLDGRVLTAGDGRKGELWDVVYNQWVDEDMSRPQNEIPDKPGYVREYGDYEFGGAYSTSRERIGAGMDKLLLETWNHVWSLNRLRQQYPWTMGVGTWEMFDSNVPWEFAVCGCGLADISRREKPSYWFYESQVAAKPMVKLATTWQPGDSRRTVVVFGNCEETALYLNGKEIARSRPERGVATTYSAAKPFDGTNTANLVHPPTIFQDVSFSPGKLSAVGLIGDKVVATDSVQTASAPVRLKVWVDDLGVAPSRNDLLFVRAALMDQQGVLCPLVDRQIRFEVLGTAIRVGDVEVRTEMGVASQLIRTSSLGGSFTVRVKSGDGLKGSDSVSIR